MFRLTTHLLQQLAKLAQNKDEKIALVAICCMFSAFSLIGAMSFSSAMYLSYLNHSTSQQCSLTAETNSNQQLNHLH
ncbi:hypothetical protein [Phormidesmis sp. 146-33]